MINRLTISLILSLLLMSCSSTNPTNVKISDAQKINKIDYGIILTSLPVKIKGESNWVGATAGAMIGTKCQDIGVVFGAIGGAAAGTVTQSILGNHDGFQYIVDIDNSVKNSAFVQGDSVAIADGQKVIVIYGDDIRILPYNE